ncbi:hypothetical protein VNO77_04224 [Canavalia gladiata]|uniref:Secreted protein n=1 Tax=Canavalia gladiata TaxID=3824 RepID=A0AAN9N2N2_CANGL
MHVRTNPPILALTLWFMETISCSGVDWKGVTRSVPTPCHLDIIADYSKLRSCIPSRKVDAFPCGIHKLTRATVDECLHRPIIATETWTLHKQTSQAQREGYFWRISTSGVKGVK